MSEAPPLRIALFTLESLASAGAVRAFVEAHTAELVLIGRSTPYRAVAGGAFGQFWRHMRRSGVRFLPYLYVNFVLPSLVARIRGQRGLAGIAQARGIALLEVEDVNAAACHAALRAARPDVILSFHFDQIFTLETLALAPLGGVNVHPSLLPRHRGPIPAFWALQEGLGATGVSIHRIAARIDAGEVLAQRAHALPAGVSASTAARLLHEAALPMISEVLRVLAQGEAKGASPPVLPYCGFPSAAEIRAARRQGVRLVRFADWRTALGLR
ncbi:MAG: formyl transferase [Roseomonas sp.]|nr:formyl transferase [Roseomonas sp.]